MSVNEPLLEHLLSMAKKLVKAKERLVLREAELEELVGSLDDDTHAAYIDQVSSI